MRYLFSIVLLLFVVGANAQENGDTKVLIKTELTEDASYKAIGQFLMSKGYKIAKSDAGFGTIETEVFSFKNKGGVTYKQSMLVSVNANLVTVTSKFKLRGMKNADAVFEKGTASELAFERMSELASALKGTVSYSK